MPMLSPEAAASGVTLGGEGCQYPQTIAVDSVNGRFLLYGTDVGGIYRSVGDTYMPCMTGYYAVGACGFAIDPRNPDHCLAVGDNTGQDGNKYYLYDGVYLSANRGASWKHVFPNLNRGNEHGREQIAFDGSSYDSKFGYCTIAYWAEEGNADESDGRLYKTVDGGQTWEQVADGANYGGGDKTVILKVNAKTGTLYLAGGKGLWVSTDGGKTFTRTADGAYTSLDLIPSQPQTVWLTTSVALMKSVDGGRMFTRVPSHGISGFLRLSVSPADPRRMVAANPSENRARYFSRDGGATWAKCAKDMHLSWIPADILYDDRCTLAVWHPTRANIVWGIGPGDIITRSTDGARTFVWANGGNTGIMTGGLFNFNTQNPNILYVGSQDYNGALTVNSGKTWRFVNLSKDNTHAKRGDDGDPWGWVYGGYAASDRIYFGGNRAYAEDQYNLWITFDGGKTTSQKYAHLQGAQVSFGDPTDRNTLFCWNVRSTDRGQSWTPMTGCDGVYTANPRGSRELYGRNGKDIVRSKNHGASWTKLTTLPANVRDVAYDPAHDRIYAAADDNDLYRCQGPDYQPVGSRTRLPKDQHGDGMMVSTVAVDPVDPNVVYTGANGTGLFILRDNGVARSLDGGLTWEKMTNNPRYGTVTGGQMASAIRVHPVTRELYVGTDCYGMWRFPPPGPKQ